MDITKKIEELLNEKEEKVEIEIAAHKRIIEIDRQVKSLRRVLKDVNDILSPEEGDPDLFEISAEGIQPAQ